MSSDPLSAAALPFGRVLTAMVTPFDRDGQVDHPTAARLARHLLDTGSDGLVVAGTTGESPTLTSDEKVALFHTIAEAVGERGFVVAGTGTYDTAASVRLTRRAEEAGVHGVLAVTPYYNKPEQAGLVNHFNAIADASTLPVLVYNIPGRTGRLIEVATIERLSRHERIVAVKDAVMDLDHTSELCRRVPDLPVYSGQDSLTLPMMAVGAVGVVSVTSHVAGRQVAEMVGAMAGGDVTRAMELHRTMLPLCWALFRESNPGPVKAALSELWAPVGDPRLPLSAATDATMQEVRDAVRHLQEMTR